MIILRDNREQTPWEFSNFDVEVVPTTLKTGDYTIQGYENIFVCERKATTGELAINIGKKWKAFSNELTRMEQFKERYLICEFPLGYIYDFPAYSGIPIKEWKFLKIKSEFLAKRIEDIISEFNIKVIFTENKLEAERKFIEIASEIIRRYSEKA